MKIWDEELIPKICDDHLVRMWQDCWKCFEMVQVHGKRSRQPCFVEFQGCPLLLVHRIEMVYNEAVKRGYVTMPESPPDPYDVTDQVLYDGIKELQHYVPWLSVKDQINLLKQDNCLYCRV